MALQKGSVPANLAGIGLRSCYISHILKNSKKISQEIGWLEVHSENYHNILGHHFQSLKTLRKDFQISLHSVGNSLGSAQKIDLNHLKKLKNLVDEIEPFLISDHISWGAVDRKNLNDLLPLPYTKEALKAVCKNISTMQDFLGRKILIENPSAYLSFKDQDFEEVEFINLATEKTGCGLLLDVNNVFVSSQNCAEFEPKKYLEKINPKSVCEIHLAGHSKSQIFNGKTNQDILIDTHNDVVCEQVWEIYKLAIKKFGAKPSLIEWDQDFPEFETLLLESRKAAKILKND
jgi:uncharacterized protein (UPF0276 family)